MTMDDNGVREKIGALGAQLDAQAETAATFREELRDRLTTFEARVLGACERVADQLLAHSRLDEEQFTKITVRLAREDGVRAERAITRAAHETTRSYRLKWWGAIIGILAGLAAAAASVMQYLDTWRHLVTR